MRTGSGPGDFGLDYFIPEEGGSMKPQKNYGLLWYFVGLLCLICSTSYLPAETCKADDRSKLIRPIEDNKVLIQQHGCQELINVEPAVRPATPTPGNALNHGNTLALTPHEEAFQEIDTQVNDTEGHGTGTEPVVDDKRLEELIGQLESGDLNDRISACMELESLGPAARPAIPALRRALRDNDATVRILAASTLGGLGPAAATAVPDLVAALKDKNEYVRVFVATALGNMESHAHAASEALQNVLNDPNALVRSQAEWALQQIGAQDQSTQKEKSAKTGPAAVKSSTDDSPQKSPLRSFHYQEQQLIAGPLKPAVDDPRFDRVSALVQAAGLGDLPTVELLLQQNVTPYTTIDETGRTPLHEAAAFGHTEVVRTLIQAAIHKDQLNLILGATDQRHRTPLHYAAIGGHVDVARVLLEQGAVIDAHGPDGLQPLHLAIIKGNKTMAEFLLARGAYVLARDAEGRTATDYARALHHDDIARNLEEETLRYWQSPTVKKIRTTIENYLAGFESGDVSTVRTFSTKYHYKVLGDSIKALSFEYEIQEIQWYKDEARGIVRITMPGAIIPFRCFIQLKQNKGSWQVDRSLYGFVEQWEDIK